MIRDFRLVAGDAAKWRADAWQALPPPLLARRALLSSDVEDEPARHEGRFYFADQELIDAANVAIELGQPLLLTGEPGAGKSSFADHVAWQLGLPPAERFQLRADMSARDLFYRYDDMARFRAANEGGIGGSRPSFVPEEFLHLAPLGRAIVVGADPTRYQSLRTRLFPNVETRARRSVVLLDEIDKAPRDVPNDLLGYLTADRIWFDIPELGGRGNVPVIEADPDRQPIVICTSNSEKGLPDAFLRRCIFFNINFPKGEALRRIVALRATGLPKDCDLMKSIEAEVVRVRDRIDLQTLGKKPGLAEVLSFALALTSRGYGPNHVLADADNGGTLDTSASVLLEKSPIHGWQDLARVTLLKDLQTQQAVYPAP